jgi:hypothetical protein
MVVFMSLTAFRPLPTTFVDKARLLQHTLEQPQVIQAAQKWVPRVFYPAITAKILTEDVFRRDLKPHERQEHLRRDLIVLPVTIAGTLLATRWFMHNPAVFHHAPQGIVQHFAQHEVLPSALLKHVKTLTEHPKELAFLPRKQLIHALLDHHNTLSDAKALPALTKSYQHLKTCLHQAEHYQNSALDAARDTLEEGMTWLKRIETHPAERENLQKKASHKLFTARLRTLFPTETKEDNWDEVKGFVGAGAVTIGSGVLSGLLANRVNRKDTHADQCVLKEGIFQMVANVLFCGLGVSLGEIATQKLKLQNTTLPRMGVVGGGLMAGILSGSLLANSVGNAISGVLMPHAPKRSDRKLEVWDATIHVDDIPLLFKFGMDLSAMEPFIPPFFWFSGFRAGRGYRNKGIGHHPAPEPSSSIPNTSLASRGVASQLKASEMSPRASVSSQRSEGSGAVSLQPSVSFSNITRLPSATIPHLPAAETQPVQPVVKEALHAFKSGVASLPTFTVASFAGGQSAVTSQLSS